MSDMPQIKITYLERIYGAWYLRFSGDTTTFQYLLTCLKERRRLRLDTKIQWVPSYHGGVWRINCTTFRLYRHHFSNYAEELRRCNNLWKGGKEDRKAEKERQKQRDWQRMWRNTHTVSALSQELSILQFSSLPQKEELITRYRTLAKQYHPDLGGDHTTMVRINNAYKIILAYVERVAA